MEILETILNNYEYILNSMFVVFGFSFGSQGSSGQSQQKSKSKTRQGLFKEQGKILSKEVLPQIKDLFEFARDRSKGSAAPLPTDRGFLSSRTPAIERAFRDTVSSTSAEQASRGRLRPDAIPGIVGRATTRLAPGLVGQSTADVVESTLAPIRVEEQRIADLLGTLQQVTSLLGGSATAASSGSQTAGGSGSSFGLLGKFA